MNKIHILAASLMVVASAPFAATNPQVTTETPITQDSVNNLDFYLADQFTYDDNLYRLPTDLAVPASAGSLARRADGFNSVSLGGDGRWFSANQAFGLNFRADENRFTHNDTLNNVSGRGNLEWDWRFATLWSGQVGASYYRALADFANTGFYGRDVVQREDYFGNLRYQVGPHLALYGGFIGADTSQSAVPEQLFNFHSNAGNAGVEFSTSAQNTISLDYRYTAATFPQDIILNGALFNQNYREDTARILVKYVFTAATELDASAGYLKRDYPESRFATFSGNIWRAALQWQPTDNLQWVLSGWRQLAAYVDAESDYFVSNGFSVAPVWKVLESLTLSLAVSRETHDYLSSSPTDIALTQRRDKLTSALGKAIYNPTDSLGFNLTTRYDKRNSNIESNQFDDRFVTVGITYKIRP
jgi:hypothetical protein